MERRISDFKIKVLMILAFVMAVIGISEVFAQASNIYKLQSLFIYNFTKHVKWENTAGATFTIGVFGSPKAFSEIRPMLENKVIWGKNIEVIQISAPSDVNKCHIAYMPKSNKKKILDLIDAADLSNTLLVTEDDLMNEGAAISFVFEESKMKFKISKEKIEESGLKVSSSLLSIGIVV